MLSSSGGGGSGGGGGGVFTFHNNLCTPSVSSWSEKHQITFISRRMLIYYVSYYIYSIIPAAYVCVMESKFIYLFVFRWT